MNIRHASLADLESITAIEAACFPEAEAAKKKDFEARLQVYPECFWVLCNQNEMIGFVDEGISESVHGNVIWYQMRLTF